MIAENIYYLPISKHQVGIDAFFLRGGTLYLFQCTGSSQHDISPRLAAFLDRLKPRQPIVERCFIFIVPAHLKAFKCSTPSDKIPSSLTLYVARIVIPPDQSLASAYRMLTGPSKLETPIAYKIPMEVRTSDLRSLYID